jgi:hypothetical protein
VVARPVCSNRKEVEEEATVQIATALNFTVEMLTSRLFLFFASDHRIFVFPTNQQYYSFCFCCCFYFVILVSTTTFFSLEE